MQTARGKQEKDCDGRLGESFTRQARKEILSGSIERIFYLALHVDVAKRI